MTHSMKILCLICASALLTLALTGCGSDPDILSDAEEVMSIVMDIAEDIADPTPPTQAPAATDTPDTSGSEEIPLPEEPAATEEIQNGQEASEEISSEEPGRPATEEPANAVRPGEYIGSDGSVLHVAEDGTCTYDTTLSGTINGDAMTSEVTFHGTVENGEISFTKITYFGLDITALAAMAGYDDSTYWETVAEIIYNG